MMNFTTIFGNICIYFKLPDWVQDFEESLVENEDDFPSITALKRFLRGDDEYRKKALKVMPGTVAKIALFRLPNSDCEYACHPNIVVVFILI